MVSPSRLTLIRHIFFHSLMLWSVSVRDWTESYLVDLTMLMTVRIRLSIFFRDMSMKWCYLTLILDSGLPAINSSISFSLVILLDIFYLAKLIEQTIVSTPLFNFPSKNSDSWLSYVFIPSLLNECRKLCQSFLTFSFFFPTGTSTRMISETISPNLTCTLAINIDESLETLSSSNLDILKSLFLFVYNASLIVFRY